jgi:hypothetical protein
MTWRTIEGFLEEVAGRAETVTALRRAVMRIEKRMVVVLSCGGGSDMEWSFDITASWSLVVYLTISLCRCEPVMNVMPQFSSSQMY